MNCLSHVALEIGLFQGPFPFLKLLPDCMSLLLPEAVWRYAPKQLMYIWQLVRSPNLPLGMDRSREIDEVAV